MNDDTFAQKSEGARSPKNKIRARCPACGARVNLRDTAEVWDMVTCTECNTLLEIVDLRPPTLDYATDDVEEDWDEEDWDEFDKP